MSPHCIWGHTDEETVRRDSIVMRRTFDTQEPQRKREPL